MSAPRHSSSSRWRSADSHRPPAHMHAAHEGSYGEGKHHAHDSNRAHTVPWRRIGLVVSIVCLLVGYMLLSVVLIMERVSAHTTIAEINEHQQRVASISSMELQQLKADLDEYNKSLGTESVSDPFVPNGLEAPEHYREVLGAVGTNMIGQLSIPSIGLNQPIHYGHGEAYLGDGVEHMPSTAIPDNVPGTNTVLAGHSGLDNTIIFDNLDQLEVSDTFQITVLDWQFTYEVDSKSIVNPDAIETLNAQAGHTYVSLLTCWPRYINSHRLIVRGELIHAERIEPQADVLSVPFDPLLYFVVVVPLLIALAAAFVSRKRLVKLGSRAAHQRTRISALLGSLPRTAGADSGGEQQMTRGIRRSKQNERSRVCSLTIVFWVSLGVAAVCIWALCGLLSGVSILPSVDFGYSWFDTHVFYFFGV